MHRSVHQQRLWSGHAADGYRVPRSLLGLGVSRIAATAAVASTLCFDWSPSDTGTILSFAETGLNPVIYRTDYQVPIVIVAFFVGAALYFSPKDYADRGRPYRKAYGSEQVKDESDTAPAFTRCCW